MAGILPLLGLLLLQTSCFAHTWTAKDGRTIEGDLVARTDTAIQVLRSDSGATVTIPFSMLSAADVTYAQSAKLVDANALAAVIASFPKLTIYDDNDTQLFKKYSGYVRLITVQSALPTVKLMRDKLPADIQYWTNEAKQPWPEQKDWSQKLKQAMVAGHLGVTQKQADAARDAYTAKMQSRVDWLTKQLPAWLDQVEKAAE